MAEPAIIREKLQSFMERLSPGARAMLARRMVDDPVPAKVSQPLLRERPEPARAPQVEPPRQEPGRADSAALFDAKAAVFAPFLPHILDERLSVRLPGWIERASLDSIWSFACRELLPADLGIWAEPRPTDFGPATRDSLTTQLRRALFLALGERDRASDDDPRARQRLISRLGGDIAYADFADLRRLLGREADLRRLATRMPAALSGGDVSDRLVIECVVEYLAGNAADADLVAAGLANRVGSTSTLAAVAIALAPSSDPADIRRSAGRVFVDAALSMAERQTIRCRDAGRPNGLGEGIKRFHEAVRGLITSIDINDDPTWRQRLAAIRRTFSETVSAEIERLVPSLRRAFHIEAGRAPADSDAAEAAYLAAVYGNARAYRDSLAVNELLSRLRPVVDHAVQVYADDLGHRLRGGGDDRQAAVSVFEHFLAVAAHVNGEDYASYLRRASASAAQGAGDRKAPPQK